MRGSRQGQGAALDPPGPTGPGPRFAWVWCLGVLLCCMLAPGWAWAQVSSVYLIQNSGWMEPFYVDPAVQFRPLLNALVAASNAGGEVVIADFNQDGQLPDRHSPHVIYRGPDDAARIAGAIATLDLPVQPNGHLTDADFDGALVRGINTILDAHPGIIWLVTNNRNSPSNSQRVDENTRDFARRLGSSPALPVIVSYPVRLPAQGQLYSATGLIVYGIAYGQQAATELRRLTRAPGLTRLFSDPAVQLKPLDQAPLVFTPQASDTPGLAVSRLADGSLRIDGVPGNRASTVEITGTLRSDYYPHVIDQARVSLRWDSLDHVPGQPALPLLAGTIEPPVLQRVAPRDVLQDVRLRLDVPRIERTPGIAGWFQKDVTLHGTVAIELSDLSLSLQDGFAAKMAQIAALDQLPAVFFDNKTVTAASALLPVTLVVRFSAVPLILALLSLSALLALAALLLVLLRLEREHTISLAGQVRRMRLRAFQTRLVTLPGNRVFAVRGRLLGKPAVAERPPAAPR